MRNQRRHLLVCDQGVQALMAIGEKGQSNLWLNPRMLPSLGSVGIQLGTCK